MAIVSSSSRPPDPPSSDSESPTFMTLPVEIRLKIYEALLDKIKVKYTVQRHPTMHEYWRGETGRYKVVRRTPEPYHSFAILTASKKINEEAQNAAATCPVVWEVEGCMDHCSLDALLPETVVRRVCSIITDESFWYGCKGSLKCCFDRQAYSNLRHLELRGPPKRITMPLEVLMRLSGKDGFDGYQLSPEICVQVQNSWPSWTPQLAQIIVSGQLTIKIRCDMFIRRMPAPAFTRADTEISALVVMFALHTTVFS